MAETTLSPTAAPKRFDFKRLFVFLRHPQATYAALSEAGKPAWQLPMLTISVTLLLNVIVSGYFQAQAAALNGITLPPDSQWWTPEMQNNYMTAMQQTQGPVFLYVIPAVMGLASLWLGWLTLSGMFHLTSTLFGGRGSMSMALNVVAWASLPFAVRDVLRVVFMLLAGHTINSPGLSGFIAGGEDGVLFLAQILKNLDVFIIWYAILTIIGFKVADSLPTGKAVTGVLIVVVLSLLAQSGLGVMSAKLGGLMISRPF